MKPPGLPSGKRAPASVPLRARLSRHMLGPHRSPEGRTVQTLLQLLIRIVANVGAIVTAAALLATVKDIPALVTIVLWVFIVGAACLIFADVVSYVRSKPRRFPFKSPGIAEFLSDWLSSGGQSAVFS